MNPTWPLQRTSRLSELAVSLDEAKNHLRISGSSQDSELELLIEASTEKLERDINRGVVSSTWIQSMYTFPADGAPIELMMGMNTAVSSVRYTDTDGNQQTLDSWTYSQARGCIFNNNADVEWPEVYPVLGDRVEITFTCGVGSSDCVPRLMKQAILLETGRAYFDPAQENQANTDNGKSYEMIVRKLIRSSYP